MKLLIITLAILLTGCTTAVPIKRNFPEVPPVLMRDCRNLQALPESTTKLSEVLTTVTQNYSAHHECQYLMSRWQEWYQIQKLIFEQAN